MGELLNVKVKDLDEIEKYFEKEIEKISGTKFNLYEGSLLDLGSVSFVMVEDCIYSVPESTSDYKTIVRMSGVWYPQDNFKDFREAIDFFFDDKKAKTFSALQNNLLVKELSTDNISATSLENRDTIHKAFMSMGAKVTKRITRDTISIFFNGVEFYIIKCNGSFYLMTNDCSEDLSIKKSFEEFGFKDFIEEDFDEIEN